MSLSSMRADGTLGLRVTRGDSANERRTNASGRWLRAVQPAEEVSTRPSEPSEPLASVNRVEMMSEAGHERKSQNELADHELLQRYQTGDEKGYVELYVRRQAEVYTFCLRLASGDRDVASDVFQDVWLKVYRKAHTFREGTNVLGWLYTIARTTFLNHRRHRTHVGLDEHHSAIASTDRSMQPEFRTEQMTLKLRVEQAIAQLPIEIREPFILREFDGFSYLEIAEQLHVTHGAVRQRIYRAKQAMRTMLADLIEDENEEYLSESASMDHRRSTEHDRKNDHGNV